MALSMIQKLRSDLFLLGALAMLAVLIATSWAEADSPLRSLRLNAEILLHAIAVAAAFTASFRTGDPKVAGFWRWFGGGLLLWLLLPYLVLAGPDSEGSLVGAVIEDTLYFALYLMFVVALEHVSGRARPDLARPLVRLGTFFVLVSIFVYFILIPARWNPTVYMSFWPSYYCFAAFDLFIAARIFLLWHSEETGSRGVYGWLLATAILWSVADATTGLRREGIVGAVPEPWQGFGQIAFVTVLIAARVSALTPAGRVRELRLYPLMTGPGMLLSYALIVPGIHVVMHVAGLLDSASQSPRAWVVIVTALVLIGLGIRARLTQRSASGPRDHFHVLVSEEQVNRWRHVDSLGQLAGAMVHDFSNVLMVIKGYTELLLDSIDEGRPDRECAEQVQIAADRARSMTEALLAFGRRQKFDSEVVDLNKAIAETRPMLKQVLGPDVNIEMNWRAGNGWVRGDVGQLTQVILNLGVNARAAMPEGGAFTIETADIELEALGDEARYIKPGPYVMIRVSDTGVGMDAETRKHIFEPFFTTRTRQGTGLGLATVFGIVRQSGGYIDVLSEAGVGTTFEIYLPRVDRRSQAPASPAPMEKSVRIEGNETILLVEDEEGVRGLTAGYLRSKGYRVVEAQHAAEALRRLEEASEPIDLLLTDIAVPEIDGLRLAELVRQLIPGLGVVYMSTFPENAALPGGEDSPEAFIQKPFSLDSLGRAVRGILDASPGVKSSG